MPQFLPGVVKTAIAPIVAKPSGMSCEAELFLGPDDRTKVAASGRVPFVSTGSAQSISLPLTMPTSGKHHVYIDVYAEGARFLAYQSTADVEIVRLLEFDSLSIASVEGQSFVETGLEPLSNLNYVGTFLEMFAADGYLVEPFTVAALLIQKIPSIGSCSYSDFYAALLSAEVKPYLRVPPVGYGWTLELAASTMAHFWSGDPPSYTRYQLPGDIAYAAIAQPLAGPLRGISLIWRNKTLSPVSPRYMQWFAVYEPGWTNVGYTGISPVLAPGESGSVKITSIHTAGGSGLPGKYYDAKIFASYIYSPEEAMSVATFRIRNLFRV